MHLRKEVEAGEFWDLQVRPRHGHASWESSPQVSEAPLPISRVRGTAEIPDGAHCPAGERRPLAMGTELGKGRGLGCTGSRDRSWGELTAKKWPKDIWGQ